MTINELLREKKISKYRLSRLSGVPYTTINDICTGKTRIEKCSADTIYKIAKVFSISMEELIKDAVDEKSENACSFDLYKSSVCHRVKDEGDIPFIIEVLQSGEIRRRYEQSQYREALYLLAMVDYLSRINELPICSEYKDIRIHKLKEPVYPASVIALARANNDESVKEKCMMESIPEFRRFNIAESEVRDIG